MTTHVVPTLTAEALDSIAESYDVTSANSVTIRTQRELIWRELDRSFLFGQRVIEHDCRTALDVVHLSARGVEMWACEESAGMLEIARRRVDSSTLHAPVHLHRLPTSEIAKLGDCGPFDGAFSNFGALNCVEDTAPVARSLAALLRPGGKVVLCIAGTCVAWEILLFLWKGRYREAFRRWRRGPVRVGVVGDLSVACWYPSIRAVRRAFQPYFRLTRWVGVGVALPPTYVEHFVARHPSLMDVLFKADPFLGRIPLVRSLADHLVLTFERVGRGPGASC
jgi:SAM-dependent methyltransferase